MAIVPLADVWIDANFREEQLRRIRVGQPVTVHADLYGSDVAYRGTVAGLAAGSGSAFALLPAQNASGNWIKIVQRVPVRIRLEPGALAAHPLRIGLSTFVQVDVRDSSGPLVARSVRTTAAPAAAEEGADQAIEARIRALLEANGAGGGAVSGGRRGP